MDEIIAELKRIAATLERMEKHQAASAGRAAGTTLSQLRRLERTVDWQGHVVSDRPA